MEKVGAAGAQSGKRREGPAGARAVAVLALLAASPLTWAADAPLPPEGVVAAQADAAPRVRLQVQASALPQLDAPDDGFQAPRVDLSLFPRNARGLGAVLGVSQPAGLQAKAAGFAPRSGKVDVGLRWTHTLQNQNRIDVTAWRRVSADDAYTLLQNREPVYGARVEMKIQPAKVSLMGLEKAFLGFQLQGGGKISLKRKDGRPMVYYRTTF